MVSFFLTYPRFKLPNSVTWPPYVAPFITLFPVIAVLSTLELGILLTLKYGEVGRVELERWEQWYQRIDLGVAGRLSALYGVDDAEEEEEQEERMLEKGREASRHIVDGYGKEWLRGRRIPGYAVTGACVRGLLTAVMIGVTVILREGVKMGTREGISGEVVMGGSGDI